MKAPPRPLTPFIVNTAIIVNQLATPGLGSLIARRWAAGWGQLALSVTGFTFFIIWFVKVMMQFYGTLSSNSQPQPVGWIAWTGLVIFAVSWLWALTTSISIWREAAKQREIAAFR